MNEKVYTAWFPECCAPTLITRDMGDMDAFLREEGKIVCKPLDGMGGRSIFVVEHDDKNRHVIFETLSDYGGASSSCSATCRRSSPAVTRAFSSSRASPWNSPSRAFRRPPIIAATSPPVPRASAVRSTSATAGSPGRSDRSLRAGMLFVGLDVIGGFVTEINVTSPTGIRELDKQFGTDIGAL
jgi:glutathione synthase